MKKTILTTLALNVMLFFLFAFTTHAEEVVPSPKPPASSAFAQNKQDRHPSRDHHVEQRRDAARHTQIPRWLSGRCDWLRLSRLSP